jgi:prevent-host-death family protein
LVRLNKMAKTVNLHEARTSLSRLVEKAARGEEIVITKAGLPRARLVPMGWPAMPRKPGAWKGRIVIAADFDTPLPDGLLVAFRGADR